MGLMTGAMAEGFYGYYNFKKLVVKPKNSYWSQVSTDTKVTFT